MKFKIPVILRLEDKEKDALLAVINRNHLGDENCNHFKGGRMVSKYPDKETEEFREAHWSATACNRVVLIAEYDENTGELLSVEQER